jgi:hypothetical protein
MSRNADDLFADLVNFESFNQPATTAAVEANVTREVTPPPAPFDFDAVLDEVNRSQVQSPSPLPLSPTPPSQSAAAAEEDLFAMPAASAPVSNAIFGSDDVPRTTAVAGDTVAEFDRIFKDVPAVEPPASAVPTPASPAAKTPQSAYAAIVAILGDTQAESGIAARIDAAHAGVDDPALKVFAEMCKGILAATHDEITNYNYDPLSIVLEKFSFIGNDEDRDTDATNQKIMVACAAVANNEEISDALKTSAHGAAAPLVTPIFTAAISAAAAAQSQASPAVVPPAVATPAPATPFSPAAAATPAPVATTTPSTPAVDPNQAAPSTTGRADDDDATRTAAAVAKGAAALTLALAAGPAGWILAAGFLYVTRNLGAKKSGAEAAQPEEGMSEEAKKCVEAYEAQRGSLETTHSPESPARASTSPDTAVGAAAAEVVRDETAVVETTARDLGNTRTVLEGVDQSQTQTTPQAQLSAVVEADQTRTPSQPSREESAEVDAESVAAEEGQGAKKPSLRERFANWRLSRSAEEHQPLVEDDGIVEPVVEGPAAGVGEPVVDAPEAATAIESAGNESAENAPKAKATPSWKQKVGNALIRFGNIRLPEEGEMAMYVIVTATIVANPPIGLSLAMVAAGAYVAKQVVQAGARAAGRAILRTELGGQNSEAESSPSPELQEGLKKEVSPDLVQAQIQTHDQTAAVTPAAIDQEEAAKREAAAVVAGLRGSVDVNAVGDSRATAVAGVGDRGGGGRE